ncbi:chromate efflux transporter [Vicingus serpentipes]|jgi:chromate transporter|uniref:Chromate efflux transporter n=1 Tax=Vicingus serpentipes TaxID=1926625 RepID=A0A5C6RQ18_9FLAO|nr:chromate efflux transporter [Vicingus serpentipes]TXB64237.1 chromate efflux transporter [Vicingus serpentipes]
MSNLKEIAQVFFKMGCFAFGGPAVHIAMMEDEIVSKRKWMNHEHFLDLVGATNLIPGPNSTEMTMHCGHDRGGWAGMFVAGICFIFPAVFITGILAWFYVRFGELPNVKPFINGIQPAVIAIIIQAVFKLGKKAVKNVELAIFGIIALILNLIGINEILSLLATAIIGSVYFFIKDKSKANNLNPLVILLLQPLGLAATKISTLSVFLSFFKIGAILYGSGYVLFAYLDAEFVETGIMTRTALMDAVAVGQFTPGPVLSTATFVGFQLNGFWGAIAATTGIFLPSFLLVLLLNPLIPKMRKSAVLKHFLNIMSVGAVALMIAVILKMGTTSLVDLKNLVIFIISMVLVFFVKKVNAMHIVLLGSILGFGLSFID